MHDPRFFTVGGTVQAGGGMYVHRQVDEDLIDLCRHGTFGFVLTARQMGKSSLMVRTAERLAAEGTRSVVIDLSQLGVQVTPDAWYLGLLTRIEDALELETDAFEWWEAHQHLGLSQRLTRFFQEILENEVADNVVIFVDEIDSTLSLAFTDDFFAAIRYVYNARAQVSAFNRLTFVLIGVASPNDLISDSQRTPFNIGSQVNVEYFRLTEALPLAEGFDLPPEKSREVLEWILSWTGGHPYLTQRLCATAASRGKQNLTRPELDQIVKETFFGQKSEEDSNLRFVQDMVVRRAPDRHAALSTYERIVRGRTVTDDKASQTIAHLKLSGIVSRDNGSLAVSNRIYKEVFGPEWVRDQFPEHWIRRVPPAVMGLVAASFVAVIALGLFFFQSEQAAQARRQSAIQAELNTELSKQVAVSDSLTLQERETNARLTNQFAVTDSLRVEQEEANDRLVEQIRVSNQLRAESEQLRLQTEAANVRLSEQISVADSLRDVAVTLLGAARQERIETITIALASHAQRQLRLGDPELSALLARQAYLFSRRGQGQFIAPVHDALRTALDELGESPPLARVQNASAVRSISYDPSGNHLAWATEGGRIAIATMGTDGAVIDGLTDDASGIRAVAFSNEKNVSLLAAGGLSGLIKIWHNPQEPNATAVNMGQHTGPVWSLAFSSDGQRIAVVGGNADVLIWDVSTGSLEQKMSLDVKTRLRSVCFSPGSYTIVAAAENGRVYVIHQGSDPISWDAGQGRLQALAISPDGRTVATGGTTADIRLWRMPISSGTSPTVPTSVLQGHEGPVNALAFSPDGTTLASGSTDHSIQIWDVSNPSLSPILLQGHDSWIWTVAFAPGGHLLTSAGADKLVATWYVDLEQMADLVCSSVNRDLTRAEWTRFVGPDVDYEENLEPCLTTAGSDVVYEN